MTARAADGTGTPTASDADFGRPSWAKLVQWDETGALVRYRVMAFIVGTGLVLLVFVGMPLQFAAHQKIVVEVVGTLHGYLYLLYLVTAADLARRAHWRIGRILAVVAAGFVPFLAFVVEHRVYRQMREEHAALSGDGAPGDGGVAAASAD